MRVFVCNILVLVCVLLLHTEVSVGDECPFTCSVDSDCQAAAENVGATQTCQNGCCLPSPEDFEMEGGDAATSGAGVDAVARLRTGLDFTIDNSDQMPSGRGIAVLGTSEDILKSLAEELSNLQPAQDVYYIENKYYSASVPIRFDSDVEGMSQGVEALVVVIEADSKDFLFDRFAPWWEDTLALQHDASVEISLVFCRDMHMGEKEHAPFLMQARDWCVDQGFELIEGQRYDEDGIADCETGVVRLEDALQAHVWPGAVMKSRVHGGTRIVTEDDGDDDDDDDDIDDDDDDDDDRLVMESIFRRMADVSTSASREDKLQMIEDLIDHLNLDREEEEE